ncbi:MAG: hypothetical protein ACK5WV_05420 [Chryseotalea sp.]|jgi:hypothetical protein|nr:hypothetical protein [Flammeovirgaceae bacterium]MCZ8022232.1 hypothetical protein [Cytophagales bacterium]
MKENYSQNLFNLTFLLTLTLLFYLIITLTSNDVILHINHAIRINQNLSNYPANFGFYLLISFFSNFININYLSVVAASILAISCYYKYSLTVTFYTHEKLFPDANSNIKILALAMATFFMFPILDPVSIFYLKIAYIGKVAPHVWHNSTTIFVFPFAMLLFFKQIKVLHSNHTISKIDLASLSLLIIVNAIIKPSFLFVYLPATILFIFFDKNLDTTKKYTLFIPIALGASVVGIQYYLFYFLQVGSIQSEISSVSIGKPFEVFLHYIPVWYLPFSILFSLAFLILISIWFKSIFRYKPFLYAWCMHVCGFFISVFVIETGPRKYDGNFTWQNVITMYLIFITAISFFIQQKNSRKISNSRKIAVYVCLAMHLLSGLLYLIKIFYSKNFY